MELTIGDITSMVNFIDIAIKRGAIEGNEISQVARLREKLVVFANAVATQHQQAAEAENNRPEFPLEETDD